VLSLWFFRNSLLFKGRILQIIKKLEKKEDLAKYCLFIGALYCHHRCDQKQEVVVTTAAVPVLFNYYNFACHWTLRCLRPITNLERISYGNQ
jgi:hypothetical protein